MELNTVFVVLSVIAASGWAFAYRQWHEARKWEQLADEAIESYDKMGRDVDKFLQQLGKQIETMEGNNGH